MKNDDAAVRHILENYKFYRAAAHSGGFVSGVLAVALLLHGAYDVYARTHPPKPLVVALKPDGEGIEIQALDHAVLSDESLRRWAVERVADAYTFNFLDYRDRLNGASGAFTDAGWNSFYEALQKSGNVDAVKDRRLVASAQPTGAPVFLAPPTVNRGRLTWRIQFPMLITYANSNETRNTPVLVTVTVVRVDVSQQHLNGLAIDQMVALPV